MSEIKDLELLITSRVPLIAVNTREEQRVIALFRRISWRQGIALFRWAISDGLQCLKGELPPQQALNKPVDALTHIRSYPRPGIFVLLDFHPYLEDPVHVRILRDIAQNYEQTARTLVLVGPEIALPDEIKHHSARFEFSPPSAEELEKLIEEEARVWTGQHPGRKVQARSDALAALARNLIGLDLLDARKLVRTAIYDDGIIDDGDIAAVMQEKYKLMDEGSVLSFELDTGSFDQVAGLSKLKDWLAKRKAVFLAEQAPAGLDAPKGLLLLGVQGAGKSLAAKAVAGAWGVPLLRLDFATLYNKYYGETERNLREAFKTASMLAPCVLWMDEVEKGLATDHDGGGPSRRILGTLLTCMAEREAKVFLVATANDIESLPPELLRKGRFDEIFFVDLPGPEVRSEIFRIHLAKRAQDAATFDLTKLAELSAGFSGAEIEQAVVAALYTAHGQEASLGTEHIAAELALTRPLSVLMAEQIHYLRDWARERTVPAE